MVAFVLLVIGGLNWGLMGLGALMGNDVNAWNVVHMILSQWSMLEWLVYVLVGVSAVVIMVGHKKDCHTCGTGVQGMGGSM